MMNATSNPQTAAEQARKTAAEQARKNYRDVMIPDTSVPEAVRAMAEKAVDQSRKVYDRSKDALDASVTTIERTFDAAGQGAVAFNRKIIDIAQRNVNSGFDLAKSLAGAKNLSEMVELQAAYWQKLLGTLKSQAEEVRALSTKMAPRANRSKSRLNTAWMKCAKRTEPAFPVLISLANVAGLLFFQHPSAPNGASYYKQKVPSNGGF